MEEEKKITEESFNEANLTKKEKEIFDFVNDRIPELQRTRQNVYGVNLESIWSDADKNYIPHSLSNRGKKVILVDDEKGYRGHMVTLGKEDDWQSDVAQANPYIKINTAISILIDRNPEGVFTPGSSKYENTTILFEQLYKRNWEIAKSKQQLKLFAFNLAKYGWAIGRTFPWKLTRKVQVVSEYNEDEPEKTVWEERESVIYNDVFRENLDPWNCWIDDMAKPNNEFSIKDWCWRKVYNLDSAKEEFSKYRSWKYVKAGGNVEEKIAGGQKKKLESKNLVEVLFYENVEKDIFCVLANGVPVIIEPLPISDAEGNKRLSLWQTYWTLRHAESPYGIGIFEAIRYDQALLDRIRNMTIDQLTLSIYKMFFYQGTQALTETGQIRVAPGVGKQVINPKDINWLQIPGPGQEAWQGIEMFKKDVDEDSGITDPLMGTITGKTAFEIAQAKEAALKRLKTPLDNICEALRDDGYITIALFQLIYSIPEVIKITDPDKIDRYLGEIKSDNDLFERDEDNNFYAKIYREVQLGLDEDEKGNLIESKDTRFFRTKPKLLKWSGVIEIKPQSVLSPSKQLDKALDLEMINVTNPMMGQIALEMQTAIMQGGQVVFSETVYGKSLKQVLKIYDKNPEDWLPDSWLEKKGQEEEKQPLFIPANTQAMPQEGTPPTMPPALMPERMAPQVEAPTESRGVVGKLAGGLANIFRKV